MKQDKIDELEQEKNLLLKRENNIIIDSENFDSNNPKYAGPLFRGESKIRKTPNVSGIYRSNDIHNWTNMEQMIRDQHYQDGPGGKINTPLLDVSRDFLISLFFAASQNEDEDGVIYIFYPNLLDLDYKNLPRWSNKDIIALLNTDIPIRDNEYKVLNEFTQVLLKNEDFLSDFQNDYNNKTFQFYDKTRYNLQLLSSALQIVDNQQRTTIFNNNIKEIKSFIEIYHNLKKLEIKLDRINPHDKSRNNKLIKFSINTLLKPFPIEATPKDSNNNTRIKRQNGEFYFQPYPLGTSANIVSKEMDKQLIGKIIIKSSDKKNIIKELRAKNISSEYIYD